MSERCKARKIVRGTATAEAIVCPGGFSFTGDVDIATGQIVAEGNPNRGLSIQGRVLIYNDTKGSSGASTVLMTLAHKGLAPAAIVTMKPADYNLAEGAILSRIPFMCCPERDLLTQVKTGQRVRVDASRGVVEILS